MRKSFGIPYLWLKTLKTLLIVSAMLVCSLTQIVPVSSEVMVVRSGRTVGLSEVNLIRDGQFLGKESYWRGIGNTAGKGSMSLRRIGYDGVPVPALEVNISDGYTFLRQVVHVPLRIDSLILTFYAKKIRGEGSITVSTLGEEPKFVPKETWEEFSVDFLHKMPNLKGEKWTVSFTFNNSQPEIATFLIDNVTLLAKAQENTCLIEVNFYFEDPHGEGLYNVYASAEVLDVDSSEVLYLDLSEDLGMDWNFNRYPVASIYLANGTYYFKFYWTRPLDWHEWFASDTIEVQPRKCDTYVFQVLLYYLTVNVEGIDGKPIEPYYMTIWRRNTYTTETFDWWLGTEMIQKALPIRIASGDYNLTIEWSDSLGNKHEEETWFTMDCDKEVTIRAAGVSIGNIILTPFEIATLGLVIALSVALVISIVYILRKRRYARRVSAGKSLSKP